MKWIGECLEAILALDYPHFETVMIDNGSTDGSLDFVRERFPAVHILENGVNLGYARGFNAGLAYAFNQREADYCLIMNNDTKIDPDALSALVQVAESRDRVGFVTGKVYYYDRPNTLQTVGKFDRPGSIIAADIGANEEDTNQYNTVTKRPFADDIYTLVSRNMYKEIGGYGSQFFLQCEEFDWQWRAKDKGWHIYYTPKARLWHHGSLSMGGGSNPVSHYFLARNLIVMTALHSKGCWPVIRFTLLSLSGWVRALVAGLLGGTSRHRNRVAAIFGVFAAGWWLLYPKPATRVPWFIRMMIR
jgi:GT2 family glycosyltransferase